MEKKVAAGGIAGIIVTFIIGMLNAFLPDIGGKISPEISAGAVTAIGWAVAWFKRS